MTEPTMHLLSGIWDAASSPQERTALPWLLFYKRVCDLQPERGGTPPVQDDTGATPLSGHPFVIPGRYSWAQIRKQSDDVGARLVAAFHAVEDSNPVLAGLLSCPDFADGSAFPGSTLRALLSRLESIPLGVSNVDDDAFGELCEELTGKATSDARGFPAGPATPRPVARLLVEILQPQEGMSIYDGACGTGGLLRECYRHMGRRKKNSASLRLYGQEIDTQAWALCRIAMLCAGIRTATIERGDSLRNPRHLTGDGRALLSFDRVISHPPFNMRDWGFDEWSRGDPYGRGGYGVPPRSCADMAFLEHSTASLNSRGILGMVAPQGVLFRTREEGKIRRRMLQDDLIEAVINLAPDVLAPSPVPACLVILNKAKPRERREKVLLVSSFDDSGLSEQALDRIASAYRAFEDQEEVCRVVSLREIEQNGFTLAVSRYLQTGREEPRTDVAAEWQALRKLIAERNEAERRMAEHMDRLDQGPHEP